MMHHMSLGSKIALYAFLVIIVVITLIPLVYTLSASFKTNFEIAKGGINLIHTCQSNSFFDLIIEACKPEVISFFQPAYGCETLAETKEKYGDAVALMGAVTPFNSVFGTDLEWDEECMDSIDQLAGDTGFILSPGCWYPANASFGRAKRMVDIAVASQKYR